MDIQVTVKIPQYVYQQARRVAQQEQRTLDEVLNEALVAAFPSVHVNPQRMQMETELAAFQRLKPQLLAQYEGRYVALHGGELVDHDADKIAIAMRIDEKFPDEVVLIKFVSVEPDRDLIVRSPRIVH